ncbi:MAG: polyprenyl synthetase family protein [Treponema sp.]|jgi:octaprenyl-diphosphate synthase|nr:polyprenyl synthetase family protein [Treponema sp.]
MYFAQGPLANKEAGQVQWKQAKTGRFFRPLILMRIEYTRRLEKIEAVLQRWLPEDPDSSWGGMVFPGLENSPGAEAFRAAALPGRELLSRGGKRWRPLLMTLVCESLGGGETALPLAPLVEFCHNASLIHDDIEDGSDERRGRPAVHLIHGIDAAINGGCFLYFLPLSCVEPWAEELHKNAGLSLSGLANFRARIYALWGEYMRKLHLGQAMDIHWHRDFSSLPAVGEYHIMCALKTGCLARFAAVLGVCAAEAAARTGAETGESREKFADAAVRLGRAAENLGVGFQILDDVKNLTTGVPGKKRGDDVVEGKKSLPVLLYLHRHPDRQETVSRCFSAARAGGTAAPEVEELIGALESAGLLDEAREQGLALIAGARKELGSPALSAFAVSGPAGSEESRALLADFTGLIG